MTGAEQKILKVFNVDGNAVTLVLVLFAQVLTYPSLRWTNTILRGGLIFFCAAQSFEK